MEKNDIANFPRPVYNRIPNFKGANLAGQKLATSLEEFKSAKVVKVNPDKAQEEARYQVLDQDKTLIVPTPRLSKGLFNRLSKEPDCDKDTLRKLASREGIDKKSKPVPMASRIKIDLVVVGSVAVDKLGRRIGKGEGFADLEFAMAASHHAAVNSETLIATTVHDVQVFDQLPSKLFEEFDIPVDVIVTPTEVIRVKDRLSRPDHIIWNILTKEKFDQIPILKELQFKEQKAGKNVLLKDNVNTCDENGADKEQVNGVGNKSANGKQAKANGKPKAKKPSNNKKKSPKKPEDKEENPDSEGKTQNGHSAATTENGSPKKDKKAEPASAETPARKPKQYPATVSVFVGKIPRGTRVKELKEVILSKGVKPLNILWKGSNGYALIYVEKKEVASGEELFSKLKDLKIGDNALNVEPDKRAKAKDAKSNSAKEPTAANNNETIKDATSS